jgi:putative ABC transport system permease protein
MYTTIEAAGLIVSLAFVVIIACYTWQQFSTAREAIDHQRIYALSGGQEYLSAWPGELSVVMDRVPDVEAGGRVSDFGTSAIFNGQRVQGSVDLYEIDPEIFEFIPQTFISGSPDVLKDRSQVILGESFANKISPDMDPVGKTIIVRNDTCVVGGIIKESDRSILKGSDIYRAYKGPDEVSTSEFIIPVSLVLIKLREGADHKETRALIDTLIRQEFADFYKVNKPERSMTMPFKDVYFYESGNVLKQGNKPLLYVLIAVGILLLASALFNYINLSVALAGKRAKEMAIRSTLGESKGRILWRYISESIVFVAVCMALAMLLAKSLEPVFNRYMAGDIGLEVAYSPMYLAAYILIICLVGVISGLVPAAMTFRHDPVSIIKGEQRRQTKSLFSKVFIIIQNVITVALIAMALVMELQYGHLVNMPLGANVDNLYYISSGSVGRDALAAKPYVDKIGVSSGFPGKGNMSISTTVDGQKYNIRLLQCDETAFEMFGFEQVKDFGRPRKGSLWFTESAARIYNIDEDNQAAPDVFSMIWGNLETGGIIKDFATRSASEISGNEIGLVAINDLEGQSTCVLKLNRFDPEVRSELKEIGRQESLRITGDEEYGEKYYGYIPELIKKGMEETRNFISLIELFMLLATIISLLGLVAMSAYYAGMQTKDIAVRKVFGGTVNSETRRSVTEYLVLVGVAILIGEPIAVFLAERYLRQFWYRIEGYGWVFVVAAVIALVISFLAVLWQTLKAARTNPATELKKE